VISSGSRHRDRIVKTTGDGLLVEFASVVDALRWATELQATLAESDASLPPDHRIEFRLGNNMQYSGELPPDMHASGGAPTASLTSSGKRNDRPRAADQTSEDAG
jgi:hypothetical protein